MTLVAHDYPADESYSTYTRQDDVSEFGGEATTWGATLTPEIVNGSTMSIVFAADLASYPLIRVDSITAEIFYYLPVPDDAVDPLAWFKSRTGLFQGCIGRGPGNAPRIVVVGSQGRIKTSDDGGIIWETKDSGIAEDLYSVVASPHGFVATGSQGSVISSSDGNSWSLETTATTGALMTVDYLRGQSRFIVAGRGAFFYRRPSVGAWVKAARKLRV